MSGTISPSFLLLRAFEEKLVEWYTRSAYCSSLLIPSSKILRNFRLHGHGVLSRHEFGQGLLLSSREVRLAMCRYRIVSDELRYKNIGKTRVGAKSERVTSVDFLTIFLPSHLRVDYVIFVMVTVLAWLEGHWGREE